MHGGVRRRGDVRERLLAAAIQLFATKGYDNTSVSEIVGRAGVSKPTLYYYFSSKSKLCEYIIEHAYTLLYTQLKERLSGELSLEEGIAEVIGTWFEFFRKNKQLTIFVARVTFSASPGIPHEVLRRFREKFLQILRNFLRSHQRRGMISAGYVEKTGTIIVGTVYSLIYQSMLGYSIQPTRALARKFAEIIVNGVAR